MNKHKSDLSLLGEILGEFAGVIGNWLGGIIVIMILLAIFWKGAAIFCWFMGWDETVSFMLLMFVGFPLVCIVLPWLGSDDD